ncbi:hypothetical protein O181_051835 [Austropuccinia psidii MF-1]|uniref:Uncharacterized protein n=1 Tax=Austropuccinia psidii MF-1 TaxID=1389203 RepID=A0A9Q3E3S3_9BASI|nr:hypothetical protein [Austropuccinia psidii MF-1]
MKESGYLKSYFELKIKFSRFRADPVRLNKNQYDSIFADGDYHSSLNPKMITQANKKTQRNLTSFHKKWTNLAINVINTLLRVEISY